MSNRHSASKRIGPKLLLLPAVLGLLVTTAQLARAQTLTTLYSFTGGSDGAGPYSGLVWDTKGNLLGTTNAGGDFGDGTIFKMTTAGTETVLHSFAGHPNDGQWPSGGLVFDAQGNLYGTTIEGGSRHCAFNPCGGTVFQITPAGLEEVLHSFFFTYPPSIPRHTGWVTDGSSPAGGVVRDAQGNLYGTAPFGGIYNPNYCLEYAVCFGNGIVFKIAPDGSETVLHYFTGPDDGLVPAAGLIWDSRGNLYGTTRRGGVYGNGTVFKITPNGTKTVLYSFKPANDGAWPNGDLVMDAQGNLYGTTLYGGNSDCGCGTVFELTPAGQEKVLYTFKGPGGTNMDAGSPNGGLVLDAQGNLYGTSTDGTYYNCPNTRGCGTVFKVTPNGTETLLYVFSEGADGYYPNGDLVIDAQGNLYGTTRAGGLYSGTCTVFGCGTVFQLTP